MSELPPPDTDIARCIAFLEGAGYSRDVKLDRDRTPDFHYRLLDNHRECGSEWDRRECHWTVEIGEGIGYYEFLCRFYFDESGKLIAHGVWE